MLPTGAEDMCSVMVCGSSDTSTSALEKAEPQRLKSTKRSAHSSIVCHICTKRFSRRDVLVRHIRGQHEQLQAPKSRRRRTRTSCIRCAFYKVKCVGSPRCSRCEKSGILCQFDFTSKGSLSPEASAEPDTFQEQLPQPSVHSPFKDYVDDQVLPEIPEVDTICVGTQQPSVVPQQQSAPTPGAQISPDLERSDSQVQNCDTSNSSSPNQSSGAPLPCSGSEPPPTPRPAWPNSHELQQDPGMGALDFKSVFDWDLSTPWQLSPLDWSPNQMGPLPTGLTPVMGDEVALPYSFESVIGDSNSAHVVTQHSARTADLEATVQETRLPWVSTGTKLDDMFQILASNQGLHWCREIPNLTQPDAERYWNLYFEEFHKDVPLLHRATLTIDSCDPLLLCSVLAIGASYDPGLEAQEFSTITLDRLCTLLTNARMQKRKLSTQSSVIDYLVSVQVYYHIVHCASPHLINFALGAHVSILRESRKPWFGVRPDDVTGSVDSALIMSLGSISQGLRQNGTLRSDEQLTSSWHWWVLKEQRKRLAWAVTYWQKSIDFRCSVLNRTEPRTTYRELNDLYMPSEETFWDAPDAKSWRLKFPYATRPPRTAPFLGVLRQGDVAIEEKLPASARVVIQDARLLVQDNLLTDDLKALSADVGDFFGREDSNIS